MYSELKNKTKKNNSYSDPIETGFATPAASANSGPSLQKKCFWPITDRPPLILPLHEIMITTMEGPYHVTCINRFKMSYKIQDTSVKVLPTPRQKKKHGCLAIYQGSKQSTLSLHNQTLITCSVRVSFNQVIWIFIAVSTFTL